MLLDDDIVADREAEPSAFPGRLRREEWIEQLLPDLWRDPGAVVAYLDVHPVAKVFGCGRKGRLVTTVVRLRLAFGRRIKPV